MCLGCQGKGNSFLKERKIGGKMVPPTDQGNHFPSHFPAFIMKFYDHIIPTKNCYLSCCISCSKIIFFLYLVLNKNEGIIGKLICSCFLSLHKSNIVMETKRYIPIIFPRLPNNWKESWREFEFPMPMERERNWFPFLSFPWTKRGLSLFPLIFWYLDHTHG